MINFDTDNLIIVCYPAGAGGKFLINALGLSNNAVFQDATLALAQLNNNFNQADKINYLENQLQNIKDEWNDLNLGCSQLFGIFNDSYFRYSSEYVKKTLTFSQAINKLSNSNLKYFIVAHWPSQCEQYLKVWPNAKVIYFKNCEKFISFRNIPVEQDIKDLWNNIRGANWPIIAPKTFEEIDTLPKSVKQELNTIFFNIKVRLERAIFMRQIHFSNHDESAVNFPQHINWDTSWYLAADITVSKIKTLYDSLNLDMFNEELIRRYYNLWMNKLKELNKQ